MIKSGYNNPSKSKCWKLFRATLKWHTQRLCLQCWGVRYHDSYYNHYGHLCFCKGWVYLHLSCFVHISVVIIIHHRSLLVYNWSKHVTWLNMLNIKLRNIHAGVILQFSNLLRKIITTIISWVRRVSKFGSQVLTLKLQCCQGQLFWFPMKTISAATRRLPWKPVKFWKETNDLAQY